MYDVGGSAYAGGDTTVARALPAHTARVEPRRVAGVVAAQALPLVDRRRPIRCRTAAGVSVTVAGSTQLALAHR
jgi:hypothetical protein